MQLSQYQWDTRHCRHIVNKESAKDPSAIKSFFNRNIKDTISYALTKVIALRAHKSTSINSSYILLHK